MYKYCKTSQSAARQCHIVSCLLEMLHTHHYDQITVQDLCKKAEVPRKSFYRYFECKQDVLLAAIDFYIQDYESFRLPGTGPGVLRTTESELTRFLTYTQKNKGTFEALTRSDLLGYALNMVTQSSLLSNVARRLMTHKEDEALYRVKNAFLCYGIYSVVGIWVTNGCQESVEEMARILTQILTEPFYVPLDATNQ
ncbi:MAG TPA: TetR/AcrR family transcriptional regulator [Candidatus Gemmiger stercoripullorum]|nr:TetR/AcrR family transcriptional regulator [Candidatus Gemmiger stercoripullorum]